MTAFPSHSKSLSSDRRLHYSWQYRRFFNQSEVFRLSECLFFRIQNELPHARLGITMKARGSSIERNQVKRQVREFFRTHLDLLGNYDYNFVIPQHKKLAYPYAKRLGECLRRQVSKAISKKLL